MLTYAGKLTAVEEIMLKEKRQKEETEMKAAQKKKETEAEDLEVCIADAHGC